MEPATSQEPAALDVIRTETVLSRLPVHNLAKKGKVNSQILKTAADGLGGHLKTGQSGSLQNRPVETVI